jgi:hypothetical protein
MVVNSVISALLVASRVLIMRSFFYDGFPYHSQH